MNLQAHLTLSRTLLFCGGGLMLSARPAAAAEAARDPVTLTFGQPQTAGISGFRRMWDTPVVLGESGAVEEVDKGTFGKGPRAVWFPAERDGGGARPGALVFDAQHRSLLVRFPGAAQKIAAQMARGYAVRRIEVLLPYRGTELWPEGYKDPSGLSFMGDLWVRDPPRWHAVAWALRKPWVADARSGPTYNAYINGAGYWAKFGAQDEKRDRFPTRFGPAEVSYKNAEGRLDVTPVLRDAAFGATPEQRLRGFESCGLLIRKWETYDQRYNQSGYEWAVATAGRGILLHTPKLIVTLAPGGEAAPLRTADLTVNVPALAAQLQKNKAGGRPTAVMPDAARIKALSQRYGSSRPTWMSDWQWRRVSELKGLGGFASLPDTPEAYAAWIDDMLSLMPRRWDGWDAPDKLQTYYLYHAAWPAPVRQFWQDYWAAWLMPEKETKDFAHNQWNVADERGQENASKYYARTGDWRGNVSFYRYSYTQNMSTMNFNHTAALGALLGGGIIGSRRAMEDGRHGLETWPLRTWSWFDGSTQESLDHYYFALSLKGQKMFADFGPTQLDRMIGQSILAKSVEELTSSYHPGLRHFVAPSGRTGPAYVFVQQDGTKHIVHTLSHRGALTDLNNKEIYGGMLALGRDALPGMIAQQTLNGPWAPEWVANMVDEKPLPYQMTNSYKEWGGYAATPLWKRNYLGRHYGVASVDLDTGGTVPVMAQWRREDKTVENMDEIATLLVRPGVNHTNFLQTQNNGIVGQFGGMATLQHKNKMIVLSSPWKKERYPSASVAEVKSLQTTIGLFNFQKNPAWEVFVDGQRVTAYPVKVKAGQRITVRDGVSYTGIIPLPSTDLGRGDEVVITDQTGPMVGMQGGGQAKPTLLIEQYNLKQDAPLADSADWTKIDRAYGGFAVEVGDATEYKDFAAFQQHLNAVKLDTNWHDEKKQLNVSYRSGGDLIEAGFRPEYSGGGTDQLFPHRRVNGAWPYNGPGIDRDSTLTMQGTTGRLEKNGAVLNTEAGRMAYLQTEPISGTYAGFNPFPDPTFWSLSAPGGVTVKADGRLGLARVVVRPKENRLWVDYAQRDEQKRDVGMASALLVFGLKSAPATEYNGKPVKASRQVVDGQVAYVIPLGKAAAPLAARYRDAQAAWKASAGKPKQSP
uniref:Uncharacterized protein n=1 Tax=uncultured Armatimonadetes bacterium TaxID=157466 RepID=A0A6J4J0P3_9BACT|nr:hypothetical protein AVDCRST_MAG63-2671 [uncultured Armatimonadetes bacterium]